MLLVAALYKFVELPDFATLKPPLLARCEALDIKGTILLAAEGINGTIAGTAQNVRALLEWLRTDPRFADLVHKESMATKPPFYRMKVRLKREIVTLGVAGVDPSNMAGVYVKPAEWNKLLDDPNVVVVDVRNDYEVAIGTFKGALDPKTKSFRELPEWLRAQTVLRDKPKVAMFCTGGIRCEKSTAFLRAEGFNEVYHLEGGILKYLETVPESDSRWQGECFVFDERVAVGHGLRPSHYELCRSCRSPISEKEKVSPHFVDGVSCPKCYAEKSASKKLGLLERQRQVLLAKSRNQAHIGVRVERKKNITWKNNYMGTGRLEAFSDGVLAIIITIMVLELKVPHTPGLDALLPIIPVLLSYLLSFIFIGIYWNNHHHMLHVTKRVNGGILWANLHMLFWLSLVPFVTGWMGENHFASLPVALYGVVLLMASIAYYILQLTILAAEGEKSLLKQALGSDLKGKISPVVYLIAILSAFMHPGISESLYVLVALMWLIPDRRIERVL